jgi:flagellar basal-body rod protein FlgB
VKPTKTADSEMTIDKNGVVLEEEMMKLTEARMDYDAAVGFYQKSLDILKLATRKPGG